MLETNFDFENILKIYSLGKQEKYECVQKVIGISEPYKQFETAQNRECNICFDNDDQELHSTGYCDHYSCLECLKDYFESKETGRYICCVEPSCFLVYEAPFVEMLRENRKPPSVKETVALIVNKVNLSNTYRIDIGLVLDWFLVPCCKADCEKYQCLTVPCTVSNVWNETWSRWKNK